MDVLSRHQGHEARMHDLQEERLRKQEEKAAKEAAAEERRRMIEAERTARLHEMQERRKLRHAKIEQQQQEKEKERQDAAREKARDREQRLSALSAAQQANMEELQKKIQQKQTESARRHTEILEQIKERAFELSVLRYSSNHDDIPKLLPYDRKKMCLVCGVTISSEVHLMSHLRGVKHQNAVREKAGKDVMNTQEMELYNLRNIVDAPPDRETAEVAIDKERQRNLKKKRLKKMRQRMVTRGSEYESSQATKIHQSAETPNKNKIVKLTKDLHKYLHAQGTGPWSTTRVAALDRCLLELTRILERK
ncbi:PREDICTED: S phase cyclin A-associated protein in the endoplasmic reticulum-like, partial [Priapulus caudatus]|uniref:S phase cyclin A-associated protein in the endoplasmic reticulum-like n=1 Tax=Priapulus caudatus TaxID=37621 RepID=A0ABM1ELI9_PRICU